MSGMVVHQDCRAVLLRNEFSIQMTSASVGGYSDRVSNLLIYLGTKSAVSSKFR
jgi:hypothetical protein